MKKFFILLFIIISCSSDSSDAEIIINDPDPDPDPDQTEESFKKIVSDNYNSDFKFGATLNYFQLNSNVEELFLKEFNYTTPENSFKQTIVHPEPGVWNWGRVEAFLDFANSKNIEIRVHGPIGPQSSTWAKEDNRTPEELSQLYEEFLIELCKKELSKFIKDRGIKNIFNHRTLASGIVSGSIRYKVLLRAKNRCESCGISNKEKALEVDHILPKSLGGKDELSNFQALCFSCNSMKKDKSKNDFIKVDKKVIFESESRISKDLKNAIDLAFKNIYKFHSSQVITKKKIKISKEFAK